MEVVNNIRPYALQQTQDNCDKLYKQNEPSQTDTCAYPFDNTLVNKQQVNECNFENRIQATILPQDQQYTPVPVNPENYSKDYSTQHETTIIDESSSITQPQPNSHYNIIINNSNTTNELNNISVSDSYKEQENKVNFNNKNYNNQVYEIDPLYLVDDYEQMTDSVTSNDIYTTQNFWDTNYKRIKNSDYVYRDHIEDIYTRFDIENFTLPYSRKSINRYHDNTIENNNNNPEPKVSNKYQTNYILSDNKVVHEGKPNKFRVKYSKTNNYEADLNEGSISYYEDDAVNNYNNEMGINRELISTVDGNGTKYNKFVNKNERDTSLSKHEQNIMLRRNDQILASMNNVMRYD